MEQIYLISDAAKKVEVETHVLRYWEEELNLHIKRNELGHRYYTREDVERFIRIRKLKEQGFQLKAIRLILLNGNLNRIDEEGKLILEPQTTENGIVKRDKEMKLDGEQENRQEKAYRLQLLLKQMISEAVRENNEELCDDIKSSVLKELDYQFRQQEEREEERERMRKEREEEHYRKLDEVMRSRLGKREKRKKHSIF